MASPIPKPREERRNRIKPQRGEWVDLPELAKPILRPLSQVDAKTKWHPQVRKLWDAWRKDPVTQEWSPADIAYAEETIILRQYAVPTTMAEIRLRMDALGLTPKGKRDLRWRIPGQTVAPEPERKKPGPKPGKRRAHLTAVE